MSEKLGAMTIKIEVIESNLEGDRYELAVRFLDKYLIERINMPKDRIVVDGVAIDLTGDTSCFEGLAQSVNAFESNQGFTEAQEDEIVARMNDDEPRIDGSMLQKWLQDLEDETGADLNSA